MRAAKRDARAFGTQSCFHKRFLYRKGLAFRILLSYSRYVANNRNLLSPNAPHQGRGLSVGASLVPGTGIGVLVNVSITVGAIVTGPA